MSQQDQRRLVRPVHVLEEEQNRLVARRATEQPRNRRVKAQALRRRIGVKRLRKPSELPRHLRQQPAQLSSRVTKARLNGRRIADPHELIEHTDEGAIRRPRDGVARPVKDADHVAHHLMG